MKKIFVLVDCNNFFVSCERIFNPALKNIPVVVLSNNDGCMVARSNEAKKLGFRMGEPIFECRDLIDFWGVKVFSSNFELYSDISRRVMKVLSSFSPRMEIYSIDEAFLDITDIPIRDYEEFGREMKERVYREVGIPVSVGISKTKTLAKIASKIAKKGNGVSVLLKENLEKELSDIPVGDVWGIGFRSSKKLRLEGVYTAQDFVDLSPNSVLRKMTIMGWRTQAELKGVAIYDIDNRITNHKSVAYTRSFSKPVYEYASLRKKVVLFARNVSETLRREGSIAKNITVFIRGNKHKKGFYRNFCTINISESTNLSSDIVKYAVSCLDKIFREGEGYKKAGVVATNILPVENIPLSVFTKICEKKCIAQRCVDKLNDRIGGIIRLGSEELEKYYNREHTSKRYTTQWQELMVVS